MERFSKFHSFWKVKNFIWSTDDVLRRRRLLMQLSQSNYKTPVRWNGSVSLHHRKRNFCASRSRVWDVGKRWIKLISASLAHSHETVLCHSCPTSAEMKFIRSLRWKPSQISVQQNIWIFSKVNEHRSMQFQKGVLATRNFEYQLFGISWKVGVAFQTLRAISKESPNNGKECPSDEKQRGVRPHGRDKRTLI